MPKSLEPSHDALVRELQVVRKNGLLRLRDVPLPTLGASVEAVGLPADPALLPASIARLLERVLDRLDGDLATAVAYSLGLVEGTRNWPGQSRRRRAAEVYGMHPEGFRRRREHDLLDHIAETILKLRREAGAPRPRSAVPAPAETNDVRQRARTPDFPGSAYRQRETGDRAEHMKQALRRLREARKVRTYEDFPNE
ncbi:hypothetical protein [Streptosporangium sp. NPDC004631]